MSKHKNLLRFLLMLSIFFIVGAGFAFADTIEVSQPNYLTTNNEYDRNPSIVYDGSDYWVFYTKGDDTSTSGVRGTYNPDGDTYVVYYKKASTIEGLSVAAETKLDLSDTGRPTNFDQRVVSAVVIGSDIYAFVSSGQSGTDRGLYYYKYNGAWAGPTTLIADATARGGHVNVVSDGTKAYIVWESSDGSSDFYTFDGTLSSKVDISTDNQPKISLMGNTLYVISIEDSTGDIEVYSSDKSAISWSSHSTAISGAGFYDPVIFNDGTNLYVVTAPWVAADRQYLIQSKYDGSWSVAKQVSYGGYGVTEWWDYWPIGYYDGSDLYIFFTTETSSPTYSDAEIAYVKMDWDLGNEHYFYIQNAINAAVNGDTVNVGDGAYIEDLVIPEGKNNLELVGAGQDVTTIQGIAATGAPNIQIHTVDGVKIHGFTIESPDLSDGSGSGGITFSGENIEIYDNKFISNFAHTNTYAIVMQTYRSQWVGEPWNLWKEHDVSGLNIHNNIFTDSGGSSDNGYYGIWINRDSGSGTATVKENTFSGTTRWGVVTERSNVLIQDNILDVTNGVRGGIAVMDFGDPNTNDPEYNGGFPRPQNNVQILGNTVKGFDGGSSWAGIVIGMPESDPDQDLANILVNYNAVQSNLRGIVVSSSADEVTVEYNEIAGNTYGLGNFDEDESVLDAENNYWGAADGPNAPGHNLGSGDSIAGDVDVCPFWDSYPGGSSTACDADGDGYGTDTDCDDTHADINPGAAEICDDSLDNDCDSLTDCEDHADCDGKLGPNTVECCTTAANCAQDDCVVESCAADECAYTNRAAGDDTECVDCEECDVAGGVCIGISAETGKNCDTDCYDCVSGSCDPVTEDNDGSCDDDCDSCIAGVCTLRLACDNAECVPGSQQACNAVGGDCAEADDDSAVCTNTQPSCFGAIFDGTLFFEAGNDDCCGDDANEYYSQGNDASQACCNTENECVIAGQCKGYAHTEGTLEVTCNDLTDNDCDGLTDCLDPDCVDADAIGPNGDECCSTVNDCPGNDASCKRCQADNECNPRPTSYICNTAYLCSDSAGGDNTYGMPDFKAPRQGLCDGQGNCDLTKTLTTICDLAKDTATEGTSLTICVDTELDCVNTCLDDLDNDADGCTDDVDADCGGDETICDGLDEDCDGVSDEDFDFDDCQEKCEAGAYVWAGNGGNLDCCGDDSLEGSPYEITETTCNDGKDNDCDGLIDCLDPDCAGLEGPNGDECCFVASSDCTQDDCVIESCGADNECEYENRAAGATDECGTCEECNVAGGDCTGITSDDGKDCDDDCTYCNAGSCVGRSMGDYTECTDCHACNALGGICTPWTADIGKNCNVDCYDCIAGTCMAMIEDNDGTCDDDCTKCDAGSCVLRDEDDNKEVSTTCYHCDGTHNNPQPDTGDNGINCLEDCTECVAGNCVARLFNDNIEISAPCYYCDGLNILSQPETGDDGWRCTDECTECTSGNCVARSQCDTVECDTGEYCDGTNANCIDPNENSQSGEDVCEICALKQHNYGEEWTFEALTTPSCCDNDANEYYVTHGVGQPACCDLASENCVDAGGVCRDEYPDEVTCDDIDNDCDGEIDEGCDDDDDDYCDIGMTTVGTPATCTSGGGDCDDSNGAVNPGVAEVCNGIDDDCDIGTQDGADEAWLGEVCDGADSDLCEEGIYSCTAGSQICSDNDAEHDLDLCNGIDDDCNAATPDGYDEPTLGEACDGLDSDLCQEGSIVCSVGLLECNDDDEEDDLDLCNGVDDDCNPATPDGSDKVWYGTACDGLDSDLCEEGIYDCIAGLKTCTDDTGNDLDLCDGDTNDDCNPATPDGYDESWYDDACDGLDSDLCEEGVFTCTDSVKTCTDDDEEHDLDLCNADTNDDCNALTPDGSGETWYNAPCDGADSDLCEEGLYECTIAGSQSCSDTTGDDIEVCDGIDNDCDAEIDEGFDDDDCEEKCGYTWTANGENLNCCGDDALEDSPYEVTETTCNDGNDNDCDGLIDCLDSDCIDANAIGPHGAECCSDENDCPGDSTTCKSCGVNNECDFETSSVRCNTAWKCSDSNGGDNAYDAPDYTRPSRGFCDGQGNCDWGTTSRPLCDLAEGASTEGNGLDICVDGQYSCADSCEDGIDNDADTCTDDVDADCGGDETICDDDTDNDCDGLTDCEDPDCVDALDGQSRKLCCSIVDDCTPDDCVVESCAVNECVYTNRSAGDDTECTIECHACNIAGGDCTGITEDNGKNCNDDCTYCNAGSCDPRGDGATEECGTCEQCQSGDCTGISAETGKNCDADCYDCDAGVCTPQTEDNDGTCDDDCDSCIAGECIPRSVCDNTECTGQQACNADGGDCIGPDSDEVVCEGTTLGCWNSIFNSLANFEWGNPSCCGDDANEYYVTNGVGQPACCGLASENCVDAGGVCRDEYPNEITCDDGFDNDCDGLTDTTDQDCFVCNPGENRDCSKQAGVCVGSQETCTEQGQWPGCSDINYSTWNPNYEINEGSCSDGMDNDCDGDIDFNDFDCLNLYYVCQPTDSCTYDSIINAINHASNGATILVLNGTYNENVIIDKEITLKGSGYSSTATINCSDGGTGITINASSIVEGFEIKNCEIGINISADNTIVRNNSINNNTRGIRVDNAVDNLINYNLIYDNVNYGLRNHDDEEVNAEYNWWVDCTGPYHDPLNPSGTGNEVRGNVDFDPWLGVCIENKKDISCAFETDDITLSADVNGSQIDSVWMSYNINGTNYNGTATKGFGTEYSYTIPSSELVGGQNVTWNVYATDPLGVYNNSWQTFYVRNRTSLIVDPATPDGLAGWYVTEPLFTLTKDETGGNIYYMWDSKPVEYTGPFRLENIPNLPVESAGTLELNWWTDFDECTPEEDEEIQTEIFYVDLKSPEINELTPENGSVVYNNQKPNISALLTEVYQSNSGINQSTIIMKVDGSPVPHYNTTENHLDARVWYIPTSDLGIGQHTVTINVTDIAGRSSETTWPFSISATGGFTMDVYSPIPGTYESRRVPFRINLSKEVELLEYINYNYSRPFWRRLCTDCDEYGNTRIRTQSLMEGQNELTLRATDEFGTVNETNISITIDSRFPRILKTEPRRNAVTNGEGFYIRYTEDNLKEVSVDWDTNSGPPVNLTGCTESGTRKECYIDLNLTDYNGAEIEYYFNVSDYVRSALSRKTKVLVDTTPPVLAVTLPEDGSTVGRRVQFNISVSEDVTLEYSDNGGPFRRLCSRCDEYGESRARTKYLSLGNHALTIRATDKAGQTDTEFISFKVE
ncbi:hypothetical protein KY347_02130 [Candidatus Woesearchaeota archaeon]|nr:hypothetical protein [Candidatus Woesearchaeota archaeon]